MLAGPLVGRVEELEFLLETLRGDETRSAVIAGGRGVGKTRLAREVADALATEVAVEWTAATPASASIPFGALSHLLPDTPVVSPDDRLRLLRGIGAQLSERSGGRASLLVVDDAQWLDPGGAAFVQQHVVSGAGRVLLTLRTGEPVTDPIATLWKDGWAERLELQPLSALDLEVLVESVLDRPVDRPTLQRFWSLSAGNPLFARELLLGALETDAFRESDGVWSWTGEFGPSTRLAAILEDRLGRVSPSGRAVLEHLAVGEPLTLDVLTGLFDRPEIAEVERLGLAEVDAALEQQVRLSHPIYAEALRTEMGTVARQAVMAKLADAMQDEARTSRTHLLRVASWRLESGTPAPDWLFTESAEIANAVYDHALAEQLARRAVAEGSGLRASLALGDALNRQGRSREGLAVLDPLADLAESDDEHVAVAIARYFGLTTEHGFRPEFESVVLEAEGRVRNPRLRAYLRAQRATLFTFAGRLDEGVRLATISDDDADEISELRAVPALGGAWMTGGKPESACALAERMFEPALRRQADLPQAPAWVLSTYLPALVASGRLDDAEAAADFVETTTAASGGSADGPSFIALTRGMAALHRGRARTAQRCLRESLAGMRTIARWRSAFVLAQLAEACALTGDAPGATAASAEADEIIAHAAAFEGLTRKGRGWAAFARGQRSAAVELLLEAAEWCAANGQHTSELFALHDALRLDGPRRAAPALLELAPTVESRFAPVFAAHATALANDDAAALEAASTQFEELGAILLAAEAAAEASAAFGRAGLRSRAERAAARARVLAEACEGARTPILEELEQPLPLTGREREVALLASTGLSSSAIAERLFVSTRTVEGHLHRAYAKLGITDRKGLARVFKVTAAHES